MWCMIDYESVHEGGLYDIEMLKKDDRIFMFYSMGDRESVENGKLKGAVERGTSFQNIVLHKRGENALDFYISSKIGEICGQRIHQDTAVISGDKDFQALYEYWMYVADIRKRVILRSIIHRALLGFESDQLGCHDSCSDFKAIYLHHIKQYGRKMGCELYRHLKKYMEIRRNYVNVTNIQDQRRYYVVLKGYKPGTYDTINDYEHNIIGYSSAFGGVFSSYARMEEFFLDYLTDSCLAASTASINEFWSNFCYRMNRSLQYENKTIMNESLAGYMCGGVHAGTHRFYVLWIIASRDGIATKMKSIIRENEKTKKIDAARGEPLAGRAILAYASKYEYQGIKMYCSHIEVADWTKRDVHTNKLPYRLYVVIEKAKERLKVTALHFRQENWNL